MYVLHLCAPASRGGVATCQAHVAHTLWVVQPQSRSSSDDAALKAQTTQNLLAAAEEQAKAHSEALERVQQEVRLLREQRVSERRTVEEAAQFQVVFKRHAAELDEVRNTKHGGPYVLNSSRWSQIRRQLDEAVVAQREAEARADERLDEITHARGEIDRVWMHRVVLCGA